MCMHVGEHVQYPGAATGRCRSILAAPASIEFTSCTASTNPSYSLHACPPSPSNLYRTSIVHSTDCLTALSRSATSLATAASAAAPAHMQTRRHVSTHVWMCMHWMAHMDVKAAVLSLPMQTQ